MRPAKLTGVQRRAPRRTKIYRFTEQTIERLEVLSELWELTNTDVLEQLVKKAAHNVGIEKRPAARLSAMLRS